MVAEGSWPRLNEFGVPFAGTHLAPDRLLFDGTAGLDGRSFDGLSRSVCLRAGLISVRSNMLSREDGRITLLSQMARGGIDQKGQGWPTYET